MCQTCNAEAMTIIYLSFATRMFTKIQLEQLTKTLSI
uniref:Uncharacterized protein n=1 Tax=Rhizophora mucronata TaxID=61149 RepID=A0A2P2NUJ5_RHIMU